MLLNLLNSALTTYLNADPDSKKRLARLNGKAFKLTLLPFQFDCYGICLDGELTLTQTPPSSIHVSLAGTPLQFISLHFTNPKERHRFFAEDIHITGDPAIAQEITAIFDHLDIDWEDIAANVIGDAPAYRINQCLTQLKKGLKNTIKSFTLNVDDFLHEETELAPHPEAVQDFLHEVDAVYMQSERLEARIHHLKAHLKEDGHETH